MTTKGDERDHVEWPHPFKKKKKKETPPTPPSTKGKKRWKLGIMATQPSWLGNQQR